MIRRHYPKGYDFTDEKQSEINKVQKWLNDYPRELLGWRSSAELFNDYVSALDEAC